VQLTELSSRRRAAYGAVLLFAMASATFLHFGIAALSPILATEFGLSALQLGILGTMNNGVAAMGAPFVGASVDRLGGRQIALVLIAVSGLSIIGFGLAPGYAWLLAMSGVNGLAAAGSNPSTNHLLSTQIAAGRRGLLMGIKQSGVRVGQFLAGALLPLGALTLGRGPTMVIAGSICLLGIVPFLLAVPAAQRPARPEPRSVRRPPIGSEVWRLVAFAILMGTGMSAVLFYTPLYAFEELGLSVQSAGFTVGVIGFLGIFARVAAGPFAERFRTPAIPLFIMALGSTVSAVAIWGAELFGAWLMWGGVVALGLTGAVWNTVANLAIVSTTDSVRTGQASGFLHTAYLTGLSVGPVLFGALIEGSDSYRLAWLGVSALFISAVFVAVRWWAQEERTG